MKVKVKQLLEVDISPQELVNVLRKKFCVERYSLIDGVLNEYICINHRKNEYDYQPIKTTLKPHHQVFMERLKLIDNLILTLNETRNNYTEEEVK